MPVKTNNNYNENNRRTGQVFSQTRQNIRNNINKSLWINSHWANIFIVRRFYFPDTLRVLSADIVCLFAASRVYFNFHLVWSGKQDDETSMDKENTWAVSVDWANVNKSLKYIQFNLNSEYKTYAEMRAQKIIMIFLLFLLAVYRYRYLGTRYLRVSNSSDESNETTIISYKCVIWHPLYIFSINVWYGYKILQIFFPSFRFVLISA